MVLKHGIVATIGLVSMVNAVSADVWPRNAALLSSSCAACHGTNGYSQGSTPDLAGLEPSFFIQQMQDFRSGQREEKVMMRHARGYSDEEIRLMADFFANQ